MAERLNITELDFDAIKRNFKEFLKGQSTFTDYNFEGSGMSVLLDILAYNTFYNAYYTNMVANEMFLDTSLVPDAIRSHAKALNYVPVSRRSPVALVSVVVTPPGGNTQGTLTLDKFTQFQSEAIDGINYTFVNSEAMTAYKESDQFTFTDVELKQGIPQLATFLYDSTTNAKREFVLPNDDIDTSTLSVLVQESVSNTQVKVYTLSQDVTLLDGESAIYFLSTAPDSLYKVSFGDGVIGRAISNGNIVLAGYLSTDGSPANKANNFASRSIGGFSNVVVTPSSSASAGASAETADDIRFHAPLAYTSQNRAVTAKDYEFLIKQAYPNIQSISAWGGEENVPPVFGKVFIAYQLKTDAPINDTEKQRIIDEIIRPISMVTIEPVIVDPNYVYLKFISNIDVDKKLTNLSSAELSDMARASIVDYCAATLNRFGSVFVSSRLEAAIDASSPSFIGSDTSFRVEKRFLPALDTLDSYTISFSTPLHRGVSSTGLLTTGFTMNDDAQVPRLCYIEEVSASFTGIDEIQVTNGGYDYLVPPIVTIDGDGTGAEAFATIVNGKVTTVTLTNRGINYTTAQVLFSSESGQEAGALALIGAKFGTLQIIYYQSTAKKVVLIGNAGTINYETGEVTLTDLWPLSVDATDNMIRVSVQPDTGIISTIRNQLLFLDSDDATAIQTTIRFR